jgi:hypothetical protein
MLLFPLVKETCSKWVLLNTFIFFTCFFLPNAVLSQSAVSSDATGKMQVVVEAISENGELGYQEFFYDVKKRE